MTTRFPRRALPGLLAGVAALVSGCGAAGAVAGPSPQQLRGGTLARDVDLSGAELAVGSKEFTEQRVLGAITLLALQACGARTVDRTGLSGSTIVRAALEQGDVDVYWEYAGTGWTLFLGNDTTVPGERALFDAVAGQDRERNDVAWLGPARFGNQYAVARRSDVDGPLAQVRTLSDLGPYFAADESRATFCGAAEFLDREFADMQAAYGITFPPSQTYQNDFALNFVNVARSSPCELAEVFTTDARVRSLDLTVLVDDRNFFTTQLAALTCRAETVQRHPQLRILAATLGELLTVDTMIELNGLVDLEGRSATAVAQLFLARNGLIGA